MFNFLEALANVELQANPVKETAAKSSNPRLEKNPTNGADFRIMGTGKIYPSQKFVEDFNLEYTPRESNTISNGFDLFKSSEWGSYKNGPDLLLGYAIRMDAPKIELFAGVRYNEEGNPINSIMDQGTTLSPETLDLIAEGLGYTASTVDDTEVSAWHNFLTAIGQDGAIARYADFYVVRNVGTALTMPDNIYNIPKKIARGEKKGEMTTVRREKIAVLPVVLFTDEVAQTMEVSQTNEVQGQMTVEGQEVGAGELVSHANEVITEEEQKQAA